MKCSVENVILRGIFCVVSFFPLYFMLLHNVYRKNLDYFSYSVGLDKNALIITKFCFGKKNTLC